jgi:hypothetical protein
LPVAAKDRIRDCGDDRRQGRLAEPAGREVCFQEMDLDLRDGIDSNERVLLEGALGGAPALDRDLLVEREPTHQ